MSDAIDRILDALGPDAEAANYASEGEWLEARRATVGGSDAPVVVGASPHQTALELWAEKVSGRVRRIEDLDDPEAVGWGRRLEKVVLERYAEDCRGVLQPRPGWLTLRSSAFPCAHYTPDALVTESDEGPGVVEVKTVSTWKRRDWDGDKLPIDAIIQVQHAMMLFPALRWADVVGLIGGQRYRVHRVLRAEAFLVELRAAEEAFADLVATRVAPPIPEDADPDVVARALAARFPAHVPAAYVTLGAEFEGVDARLAEAKAQVKAWQGIEATEENRIKAAMGIAEEAIIPGVATYSWKASPRKAYTVEAAVVRRFLRHGPKGAR